MSATPIPFFAFLFGLCLGSFGNVLIARLPRGQPIGGRSHCPHCGEILGFLELIPVLSFIVLGGRCSRCRKPIAVQYPLVELGSALLFVVAASFAQSLTAALLLGLALWLLLLIAVCDMKVSGIPDLLNIPFVLISLIYALVTGGVSVLAPLLGAGIFALQWVLSRGRWVGSGDIILGVGMGFLLGSWQLTLLAVWFAYIVGALVASVLLVLRRTTLRSSFPFGPFLAIGTALSFFYGELTLHTVFAF